MSLPTHLADPIVDRGIAPAYRSAAHVRVLPLTEAISARRFSGLVLGMAATAFAGLAGLNFIVDPYAQYPPEVMPPLVQTSRATKVRLLQEAESPPAGLVLGSSRVLKLEPDYLQQKFGHEFFNAGVNYGKPEDFLALLRFYYQRFQRYPCTIVLGLDVNAFSDVTPVDARLLASPDLASQIPEAIPWRDRFQRWHELLSWQQTKCSLQSVAKHWSQSVPPPPSESFRADGLLVYHERERQLREGEYDFPGALSENQKEYRQLFAGYDKLSYRRCELFRKFVGLCREHDVRLIVFLTPMHPDLAASLSGTMYSSRREELITFLEECARKDGFSCSDYSQIGAFGGDAQLFVDGIHPLEANTRRLIDQLMIEHTAVATHVIQ